MGEGELRKLPVDLGSIVEIATESTDYMDSEYERSGYVDTHTGEVHIIYRDAFRGADGEIDPEDLSEWSADDVALAGRILSDTENRYEEIERWSSSESFELMEVFANGARNPHVRERLQEALRRRKPFRQFKDALFEWPATREAWFAFENHCQRDRARKWLEEFGIEAEDVSPYKPPPRPEQW